MDFNFKDWLIESDQRPQFNFWSDGTIIVYINGIRYVYSTDAVFHGQWKKMVKYRPFEVLNDIKAQIKNGHAEQLEPSPVAQSGKTQISPKNTQKTLF